MIEKIVNALRNASFWADETFDEDGYSNDDAIEVVNLKTATWNNDKIAYINTSNAYANAISIVQEVAKDGGWISVEERLPETMTGSYLVTLKNGSVFQALYVCSRKEFLLYTVTGTVPFNKKNPVIAWMPLPAPYQKGE